MKIPIIRNLSYLCFTISLTIACNQSNSSSKSHSEQNNLWGTYRATKTNDASDKMLTGVTRNEFELTLNDDSTFLFKQFSDGNIYRNVNGTFSSFPIIDEKKEFGETTSSNVFHVLKFKFIENDKVTYSICTYDTHVNNAIITLPEPPDPDAYGAGADNLCRQFVQVFFKKV